MLETAGVSELLRVVYAHGGGATAGPTAGHIIERAPWEGQTAIALATPILMSQALVGRSLFDCPHLCRDRHPAAPSPDLPRRPPRRVRPRRILVARDRGVCQLRSQPVASGHGPADMDLSVDVVGIGNREQALGHLGLIGTLQEKLVALQGGRADGPFITAVNIASKAPQSLRCRTCEVGPVEAGVRQAHANGMTHLRFKPFAAAAAMLAAMLLTACGSTGTPQDGRYQTHGGGRDNFRAEAPALPEAARPS